MKLQTLLKNFLNHNTKKTYIRNSVTIVFLMLFIGFPCISCADKNMIEVETCTKEIIKAIKMKDSNLILKFIPENSKIHVWGDYYTTKEEVVDNFNKKGNLYELFFCGEPTNEEAPLCMYEFIIDQEVYIKKIENRDKDIYTAYITWDDKEEAEKIKNNITSYFNRLTFIKIGNKWYLYDFNVFKD